MNFSDHGELVSVYEAAISETSKVIVDLRILNSKLNKYDFMYNREDIDASLVIEDDIPYYSCDISYQDENGITNDASIRLNILTDISVINNIIRSKIEGDDNVVYDATSTSELVKIDNSNEDYWAADITIKGSMHLKVNINNKKAKIIVNKDFVNIVDETNKLIDHFTIGDKIISHINFSDDGEVNYNAYKFNEDGEIEDIIYPDTLMKPDKNICPDLINLNYLPNVINLKKKNTEEKDSVSITYNDYGIPKSDSKGLVRYEEFYDVDNPTKLDSIISLHPLYYDLFDQTNVYGSGYWVLDQIILSEVDSESNLIFYDSEVRLLTKEEEEELIKTITEAPEDEPILDFIDIEDFDEPDIVVEDYPNKAIKISGIIWNNNTDLFRKENNFNEISQFEDGFRKSILNTLMNYCYTVASQPCHRDRNPEWRNKEFSYEDVFDSINYTDAIIEKTDINLYSFSVKLEFTKYVDKVWSKKDIFIENQFEIFNDKFVFHIAAMRMHIKPIERI